MNFVIKRLRFIDEDAFEAAIWYEKRRTGLGVDFLDEVDRAIRSLERDAPLYRVRFSDVRRAPVQRFKFYGVYYRIERNEVWILAIFHDRRHPRALRQRAGT